MLRVRKSLIMLSILLMTMPVSRSEIQHNRNYESELVDYLLTGYNRQARPVKDISKPVNVTIGLFMGKLIELEESAEIIVNYMYMEVLWVDELLQWNETEFAGIKSITLLPTQVWLPDFGVSNTAEKIFYEDHMKYFRILLHSNGQIYWHPGGIYRTTCPLTVTYFPFDSQICEFIILNWEYDVNEQKIMTVYNGIRLDSSYKENGEWRIADTWACSMDIYEQQPFLKFSMLLERKARYTIINVLIPIILLSVMDLLVFWLPPESGEKVSLGITVLLSFSVFLTVVDERLPRTSDNVPILTIYLTSVMVTTGLSVIVTVLILHLHHKTHKAPVPNWLRKVLFLKIKRYAVEVNTKKVTPGTENKKDMNRGKEKRNRCRLSLCEEEVHNVDDEWRLAIRRIDRFSFFVFLVIFSGLLLMMVLPYDDTTRLKRDDCTVP